MTLLEVKNLKIEFPSRFGVATAVHDASFTVEPGEIVGLVGESGAGKRAAHSHEWVRSSKIGN